MGGPMARRLLEAGYALTICDVNAKAAAPLVKKGAKRVKSPKQVADLETTILVSLPTPNVVHEVALGENGIVHGKAVKDYVDLSTTGSVMAIKVAKWLEAKGISVLDCPVSGGPGRRSRLTRADDVRTQGARQSGETRTRNYR